MSGVASTRSRRAIVLIAWICTVRWTISGAVVPSLMSEVWLLRTLLIQLKASCSLLMEVITWRMTSHSINSIMIKTLLFREGYEPLE